MSLKQAVLFKKLKNQRVLCELCPHDCEIVAGQRGRCQVRENRGGELYSLVYGRTVAENVEPIEKKPLFHFLPGSLTYSLATAGCNFHCQFCTNWQVSQMSADDFAQVGQASTPEMIIEKALEHRCSSVAYTYVEPTIFFEYVLEIGRLARGVGLANVFKTNGFMSTAAVKLCGEFLDGANVDLKAFTEQAYQRMGGRLQPVLGCLEGLKRLGVWVEVTTVVIPSFNDSVEELREIARFIADQLGTETPWHVARFFPAYGMEQVPPTPVETMMLAREIGKEAGLQYVYVGNLLGAGLQDTVCVGCGEVVMRRSGGRLQECRVEFSNDRLGRCPQCHREIPMGSSSESVLC